MIGNDDKENKDRASSAAPDQEAQLDSRIDYKNIDFMRRFMTNSGRVLSRKATGLTAKDQRKAAAEIKIMKFLALVPYCDRHKK